MENQNEDKEKVNETALPEEEVKEAAEETKAEETAEEETAEAAEETKVQESEETQILTEEMKEVLDKEAEEEIVDAKIQAGLNEAAEEFKVEQEIANTGDKIAGKVEEKPVKNNQKQTMEGKKKMEEIREEAAEVKTVYIKEKKKTGWWKIVILILTILITLTFGATALFTGLGTWQLYRIAEHQEKTEVQTPNVPDPYYYGGNGYGQSGNNSGYYDDYYNGDYGYGHGNGKEDYDLDDILEQYGIDEDFDWNDIGQYFSDGGSNNGNGSGSNNSSGSWKDDVSDWFTSLFGSDDNGATQGF